MVYVWSERGRPGRENASLVMRTRVKGRRDEGAATGRVRPAAATAATVAEKINQAVTRKPLSRYAR
ncbi:hypothetical protein GCM10010250_17440 [Streptomyces althioticus]|nr:hypothetical protein GCM10010250_17440 [Streptomyces althioticus]GGT51102.1 hypothetical protein GCM10010243_31520 [Streptomyces matensis]